MNDPNPAIRIEPLRWPADVELVLPGSKSEANRLLVAAALSGRRVTLTGATAGADVRHLVQGLATLGYEATWRDEASGMVAVGPRADAAPTRGTIDCGNAGTALRFLCSVAAITPGEWILTGDAAMRRRPIGPLVAAWRRLGVAAEDTAGCPPVRVRGRADVQGGDVTLDASASSQFVSSLLLVGAALPSGIHVTWSGALASAGYVALTVRALARLGVTAEAGDGSARVRPGHGAVPEALAVHGDWSAMGVWTCLAHATGSRVTAANLARDSGQADEGLAALLHRLDGPGDRTIDVAALPDQFPNLAVLAAHRDGTTTFTGGANLRHKESDRIAVMARGLAQIGVRAEERPDGLVVHGGRADASPATIDPAADHRIAMAFALAGLLGPAVSIADPGCVAKSYPGFWQDLATVVGSPRCVVVVGMRGAGKTTFAAALAAATVLPHVDTDRLFEQRFRPIAEFVAKYGWHNFRDLEAELVAESLQPGRIVSTGGGAIEHPATQALLEEHGLVIWLDADAERLRARIAEDPRPRPSVTGAPVAEEVEALLARRRPLFERCATIRLDASLPTEALVAEALRRLRDSAR